MSRILLSGLEFGSAFKAGLEDLEQLLVSAGYNPSQFSIDKSERERTYMAIHPMFNYRVQVNGDNFTVSFSDDMRFLTYFSRLCLSPDKPASTSLFKRFGQWMTETPYKNNHKR